MQSGDNFPITSSQIRAARALLNWSAQELAARASVGVATVRRAEAAADDRPALIASTLASIRHALEASGVIFVAENGDGPGVRLRKGVHLRKGK